MADRRITALFNTYDEAARAVHRLETSGIPNVEISLIASNAYGAYSQHVTRPFDRNAPSSEMTGAGATVGTIIGGSAGLLAGLGTVAIPGFGPIVAAGWLVSALVGAGAGAAVGGLSGALIGIGLDESEAAAYEEGILGGGVLVIVRTDEAGMARVAAVLDEEGRVDLAERRSESAAPPIGAAASTTTGLITDLMPNPLDESEDPLQVELEDERLRRITGTDRDPT